MSVSIRTASRSFLLALSFAALGISASALAQEKEKKEKKDDDVILDNRDLEHRRRMEKQKQYSDEMSSDTPFADTAPNPVALREQRWRPGIGAGFRLGYALPMGKAGGAKFKESVNGMIFLWGDVGYWPIPHLFVGLYLTPGYVFPDCDGFDSCSGWDLRFGPQVIGRFLPFHEVTPWVGVGAGYEMLWTKRSNDALKYNTSARGLELLNLQAGVDVRSRGQFLGIFLSFSLGKYSSGKYKLEDKSGGALGGEVDVEDSDNHSWLAIGAHGSFE